VDKDQVLQWIAANAEICLAQQAQGTKLVAFTQADGERPPEIVMEVRDIDGDTADVFHVSWECVHALVGMLEAAQSQLDSAFVSEA